MTENKNASRIAGWWRSDETYERVAWAVIFFLGDALLLVEVSGITDGIGWYNGWDLFFLGLGSVMVLSAIARRTALGRRVEGLGAICATAWIGLVARTQVARIVPHEPNRAFMPATSIWGGQSRAAVNAALSVARLSERL